MTEYTITAGVVVNRPSLDVIRWLATPDLMMKWILGADSVEALDDHGIAAGARTRLVAGIGRYSSAYLGEIIDVTETRLVRRYHLAQLKTGVVASRTGQQEYERTVSYDLAPAAGTPSPPATPATSLICTAFTSIPGLPKSAARAGGKSETKSLVRSLERFRVCAEGGSAGASGGFFAASFSPQAL